MKQLSLIPVCEKHGVEKVLKGAGKNQRWRCPSCRREQSRAWAKKDYDSNPEKWLAKNQAWRAANPDKQKACKEAWKANNREAHLAYHRQYCRAYYAANPKRQLEASRRYLASSPGARASLRERLARRRDCNRTWYASLDAVDRAIVKAIYRKRQRLGPGFDVDHIQPIALGGPHAPWNLEILPAKVNRRKAATLPSLQAVMRGERRYRLLRRMFERAGELGAITEAA